MSESTVKPEKITKPIQLLAAWLAGLFSIDATFLFAATHLDPVSWQASLLVIASVVNVPLFLAATFLLQTKFRPELQEDSFYSTYLSRKTNERITLTKEDVQFAELRQKLITEIETRLSQPVAAGPARKSDPFSHLLVGINKNLSDRKKIKERLAELGAVRISSFGTDEDPGRAIAIAHYVREDAVTEILDAARELGFERYGFYDPKGEDTSEDVLFGSYGIAEYDL